MRIRPTGTAYFLIVILIFVLIFLTVSLTYDEMKVKLLPALVSAITLVLTVIALTQEFKGAAKTGSTEKQVEETDHKKKEVPLGRFLNAFGWFFLQIAGVYVLGFLIAIPLWIFIYLWQHGHRWWSAVLQGAGAVLIVYLVFAVLLQVELYPGLAWQFFGSHFGS